MTDLTTLTAQELAKGYREKSFSVADVAKAHLDTIGAKNTELNAFLEVFDDVLDQAKGIDERIAKDELTGTLAGIPIATKDNILIKGKVASAASKILANHTATYDATAIARLRKEGALFIGRTNMDEFAMGSSTENSAYGPTRNPHDAARVAGGSSGGSAAAVAARMAPIALGTDTGGSVRQPGGLCGVYGFKPTYGGISRHGLIAMGSSLDQLGIFANSVDDVASVFETVRGIDRYDATTLPETTPPKTGKRIGVPRAFIKDADHVVVKEFERALDELAQKGYEIVDIELRVIPHALAAYYIIMPAEVSTNLARFDGIRYGLHVDGDTLLEDYMKSRAEGFGPESKRRIMLGTYVLSAGYYDAYYNKAVVLRGALTEEFDTLFNDVSFIATPTSPNPAFVIGEKQDPLSLYLEDTFTVSANLAGIPAISVPFGSVTEGETTLPVGVQFMGQKHTEQSLFDISRDLMNEK